jgi:hypothetical protein
VRPPTISITRSIARRMRGGSRQAATLGPAAVGAKDDQK